MSNQIVERVKKLLALAKSSNEHEAALAMQKASELMLEHGIKEITGDVIEGQVTDKDKKWVGVLGRAAGTLYGVTPMFIRGTDRFRFIGRPENILAAETTLDWLIEQVEFFYKAALPKGAEQSWRARFRREFKDACSIRVYYRARQLIAQQAEQGTSSCTALVVQSHHKQLENENSNYISGNLKGVRSSRTQLKIKATEGGLMGTMSGDRVKLQREVNSEAR